MINFLLPEVNDRNLTEGGGERDHLDSIQIWEGVSLKLILKE